MAERVLTLHPEGKSGVNIDPKSVKLDLLARGVIERAGKGSPQRLRLVR